MAGIFNPTKDFEALKKAAADARVPFDKDAWLNIAFYLDEQYVEWAPDAMTIRRIPRQEGFENTPRPVQNKIMHFVLQKHASALKSKPTADVLPTDEDPLSITDASVSLAYLRWVFDPQQADFDGELSDAVLWALTAGEGYLKWVHNPNEGRGDVVSCSPFDIYGDPYARRFRNSRYVIHSQFMDVEQIYDIYGVEVKPNEIKRADLLKTGLLRELGHAPVLHGAEVNELWMKPNRRHKDGLFVVWCGKQLLVAPQKFPYKHQHLPFTQIGSVPRPGSPHYTCASKYLRNPQMELNKFHAQHITIRETFASPKWFIDPALELEELPDDSPRQILIGNSAGGSLRPEIIQPAAMPQGAADGQFILDEMMHTAGQHEVSQAQVPGRVEAAKAIEMLKEADDSHEAELLRTINASITEGAWQLLELARQYVTNEVLVTTYGREGLPEVKKFKGTNVKAGQRVRVTMGTGLSRSRAAREDQVMRMVETGIIRDPEVVAELLDVPVGTITPSKAYDIRLARNENYTIAAGTAVRPNSWDDHEVHLREHNDYRKSAEYMSLDAEAKQMFEMHCDTHESLLIDFLKKEALKAQILGGMPQPGQNGPPGAPAPDQAQAA